MVSGFRIMLRPSVGKALVPLRELWAYPVACSVTDTVRISMHSCVFVR